MEKYTITKEQVLELHESADFDRRESLEEWFPEVFKKELEVGKWYKSKAGRIVFRTGDSDNYGFCRGMIWRKDLLCYDNNNWTEAADEEVKEVLIKEIIKRFGKDWGTAKIEKCLFHGNPHYNCIAVITTNEIWNKNGCIYNDGVFAEPLKTKVISLEKAEKILSKKYGKKVEIK